MARAAGLDVAETRLLPSKLGPGYFATKRFDRTQSGRVHMVSASAMLELDWSVPGDYETLPKVTRRVTRDQKSVENVFRRGIFNFVAWNRDDHWKQHAFLMHGDGKWSVAPSFDLTFLSGPSGEHYLTVNGRSREPETDAFLAVAANESIDRARAMTILEEVSGAVARFPDFAKRYDVSSKRETAKTIAPKPGEATRIRRR